MTDKLVLPDNQEYFKLNDVCKLANVQPYMLRFWGTEFEQLETTKTETGQRLYSRPQMRLILEIRRLLFDEGLTIAGARKQVDAMVESGKLDLTEEPAEKPAKAKSPRPKATPPKKTEKPEPVVEAKPAPKVDKAPRADVQPLLAALTEIRTEVAKIVEELKGSS